LLQKTAGCDGCEDAGATSEQELTAGDGYVEFAVGEAGTLWTAGLSSGNDGTTYDDIDFAFRFNGAGWADVIEHGVYQLGGDTTYAPGDRFRVAVVGGRVQYYKNGKYLFESSKAPRYPLVLDSSLVTTGATIQDASLTVTAPLSPGTGLIE